MIAPKTPVIILRGISSLEIFLDIMSTIIINIPPNKNEIGNENLDLGPTNVLAIWGTTNPTQPTLPLIETEQAVNFINTILMSEIYYPSLVPS